VARFCRETRFIPRAANRVLMTAQMESPLGRAFIKHARSAAPPGAVSRQKLASQIPESVPFLDKRHEVC